jgi:hypothetical protein
MTAYPTFCAASPMKPRHDPSCERRGFSRRPVHKTDRVDPHRTAIPDRNAPTYAASSNLIPIGVSSPKEATSLKGRGPPLGQNQILPRFRGRDMKQFLNFTLPPYRGVSPRRRISLALLPPTPGDSTRAATSWWRMHPLEVLGHRVCPDALTGFRR